MEISDNSPSLQNTVPAGPSPQKRLAVALLIGLLAGLGCYGLLLRDLMAGDFTWAVRGVRLWLQGIDPYTAGGYPNGLPLFYPLPALFITLPFSFLPDMLAGATFFGLSSALLAWALYPTGPHRLMVFLSTPFFGALILAQWSPLMMAACLLPWLSLLVFCKPNLGLIALTQYRPQYRSLAVGASALILSLILLPSWPKEWWQNIRYYSPATPMLPVIRVLLLLAFLKWRQPEARILGLLAFMPHQPYDLIVLWLIPKTMRQSLILTMLSWVAYFLWLTFPTISPLLCGALIYLPALAFVLWPQPKKNSEKTDSQPLATSAA